MRYVLDANILIESYKRYYAFDIVPSFWTNLIRLADAKDIISVDRVEDEIAKGKDDLATWVQSHWHLYFVYK